MLLVHMSASAMRHQQRCCWPGISTENTRGPGTIIPRFKESSVLRKGNAFLMYH